MSLRVRVLVEVGFTDGDPSAIQHDHTETVMPASFDGDDELKPEAVAEMFDLARAVIDRMTASSVHEASEQMKILEQNFREAMQ